jgi:NADH:ubiquinone oxidoreductase subunit 6 (subunit J)
MLKFIRYGQAFACLLAGISCVALDVSSGRNLTYSGLAVLILAFVAAAAIVISSREDFR